MNHTVKAVVLDIDNTLTNDVSWLKATELLGASVEAHIDIFDKFTKHELSYEVSKRQLIQLWEDTGNNTKQFWEAMFLKWPLKPDAQELVDYLHDQGYKTALITGSFDIFAKAIAEKLGIATWHANTEMVWNTNDELVDFHYVRDQAAQKLIHFKEFIQQNGIRAQDCIVIGDGDNDMELFKTTGRGIAVGKDNQNLMGIAWKSVDDLSEIKDVLSNAMPNVETNSDITVKDSSLSGRGIFATRNFKKGEAVLTWHPKVISKEEAEALPESQKHYIDIVDGQYLYMQAPEHFINHSCEPNTEPGDMCDVAIRNIKVGEEITSDYGGAGLISFECHCGSVNCRGQVK